ncbi:MAG: glycosyltransferase family 39 protein [Candidatus Hydrogenedentes bacterium]|nr:glycosyltransferase family 39 protein [Candidatus Hydrogenedentota bacterium]
MAAASEPTGIAEWRKARRRAAIALLAVILLAAGLRLYRLDEQSIWADEWPNVAHLDAPDALSYVRLIQLMYPEQAHACLYYFAQYWWARAAGGSLAGLRLLPVATSLATVPLLFLLVSLLFGRGPGLIAALFFALSPQHIWHAQEIRPYALLTPLVCVALYGFLRGLRGDGRRWWALSLCANALLPWVHLFALLAVGVQGIHLMLCGTGRWRRVVAWAAIQAALLAPFAWWMHTLPYTNEHPSIFHSVSGVLLDVIGDDVVSFHADLLPPWKTVPRENLPAAARAWLTVRPACDYLLLAASCAAACWLALRPRTRGRPGLLLFLLLACPGLVLGVLTFATHRPFLSPMYTMYNTVALYAAFGGMLTGLRRGGARIAATAALAALYGYQLLITLPEVTRTDWGSATRAIREQGTRDDLVLEFEYLFPVACAEYYLEGSGLKFRRVPAPQAACAEIAEYFSASSGRECAKARSAWLLYEQAFLSWLFPEADVAAQLRGALAPLGLECGERFFPGHRGLMLLRVQQGDSPTNAPPGAVPPLEPVPFGDILREIRPRAALDGPAHADIAALRRVIACWPPLNRCIAAAQVTDLAAAGAFGLAEGLAGRILGRNPGFGLGYLALALAHAGEGRDQAARDAASRAFELHAGLEGLTGRYFAMLLDENDPAAALRLVEETSLCHAFFAGAMRAVCAARTAPEVTEGKAAAGAGST